MPRAGWLALGAVAAALVGTLLGDGPVGMLALAVGVVATAGSGALLLISRRKRGALLAAGALVVALRLLTGMALHGPAAVEPLAQGSFAWLGTVERLGSTDGGLQRAMLAVRRADDPGGSAWPVYAW